ncbi:DEAD/DEAH box helicase [Candidatus Woesearchaeota archaeon]|nr:DEAD/DEAH box helicase [Candidatus Woesearchaeota archaeon]
MIKEHVEPRLYQETIFNTASTKNTMVVIPTGMGKTLIAELLAAHRLQHYQGSRIVLLAPTKPLADQHAQTFRRDLDLEPQDVVLFTGNVAPAKRAKQFTAATIICTTPQGLENDLVSGRISLKDVSLLIFDEAHRATGDYSYVFIAERYRKTAEHERILALTASPGSDKQTIEQVCSNLFIEELEVRSGDSPDVSPYIQEIDIHHVSVKMPAEFKSVHQALSRCHNARIDDLKTLGVLNRQALTNKTTMLRAQAALHAQAARGHKNFEHFKSMSVLAEALKVQHALELIETQGAQSLSKYMDKLRLQATKGQSKAVQNLIKDVNFKSAQLLLDKVREAGVEHPKLRAVQKTVLQHIYDAKDTKIIIFNQYRDQAVKIKESLDDIKVPAKIFVGQMKKGDTGMTQKEQQKILEEFRNGEFNCLIATSVAEEGLDIPKVDVVIFYEPIPSAIRTVQRRGRTGRLEKGKVIMLVTEGTRDEGYKWAAHHKEKRMYRVLDEVKKEISNGTSNTEKKLGDFVKEDGIRIVADHREKTSGVLKELLNKDVNIELRQLDAGDYRLGDRVVVEYKTVPDFVNSIIDGRLLAQLRGLRSHPRPLIIIEGEEDLYGVRKVHPNAILGMLGTIAISYNIPVLFTRTPQETASLLVSIARKEQERGNKEYSSHAAKPLTFTEQQEYAVGSLPGVGPTLARKLLEHFTTVKALADASLDELEAVEKVGKKKAKALHDLFNESYAPE